MKKLIFAAALAIVAVGGSLSTNAANWTGVNTAVSYPCNDLSGSCSQYISQFDSEVYPTGGNPNEKIAVEDLDGLGERHL